MLLSAVTFLPLIGALFMLIFISSEDENAVSRSARGVALLTTLATFVLSIFLYTGFDSSTADFQFVETYTWIEGYNIDFKLGIDGISLFFVLLTTFLMPFCVLCSWKSVKTQVREYMVCFLLLESLVIGVFASLDFMSFYFFFEASLIPMYLIIGIWGGENKVYAAFKFFLYTLIGSVLLLLALIFVYNEFGTTDIEVLMTKVPTLSLEIQKWLWLAFFASFAVKVPMWPFHTWLPDAHVQAPTAGSVILAGILLKLGGYGFLRFSLPMLPDASIYFTDFMYTLSVVAVIYTSLVALMQTDMKKLIAYSSIAHMGFVTIGIFTLNQQGIEGSIFQMISHGVVSAALFLCVGVVYDRIHTKEIARYGGLVTRMPKYALYFMLFTMASIGLPTTSGFVGEFLVLVGVYQDNTYVAGFAATGLILGAAYMLWLYKRVVFGELVHADLKKITDLDKREMLIFVPLAILVILMGVFPNFILEPLHASVVNLTQQISR
jgi:NADH-quinone oxidoreductase subunit M